MLILDKITGVIAPNICLGCGLEGQVLCENCQMSAGEPPQPRCAGCKALSKDFRTCPACRGWLGIYAIYVSNDYEGVYERLVHSMKFDIKRDAAKPIVKMMTDNLPVLPDDTIVCALPTAPSRIRQRGFDHANLLVKAFMKNLPKKAPWNSWKNQQLLGRNSNVRQLGASRSQRIIQMEKEYYVKQNADVQGKTILLLDDVMTTGASMSAASKTLKKAGAKRIYAIVFAQKT